MTGPVTTPPVSPPRDPIGKSVPKKKIVVKKKPAGPEKIVKKKIGKSQRP